MVVYFSRSKKTEVFAKVLAGLEDMPLFELRSELNDVSTLRLIFKVVSLTLRGKSSPVFEMPKTLPKKIYVCSPVWAGNFAHPVKYFLQNADLTDVEVNAIITASTPTGKYVRDTNRFLQGIPCIPGKTTIFATNMETMPEEDVVLEHMQELL